MTPLKKQFILWEKIFDSSLNSLKVFNMFLH